MSANSHADPASHAVYLDSSAVVKLVLAEPESPALVALLQTRTTWVSSVLAEVEVVRAVRRASSSEVALRRALAVLEGLWLLNTPAAVRTAAAHLDPPDLRSLGAIHLASALSLGTELGAFVVYDTRLARAARALGLPVLSPR